MREFIFFFFSGTDKFGNGEELKYYFCTFTYLIIIV